MSRVLHHDDEPSAVRERLAPRRLQPVPERRAGQAAARQERHQRVGRRGGHVIATGSPSSVGPAMSTHGRRGAARPRQVRRIVVLLGRTSAPDSVLVAHGARARAWVSSAFRQPAQDLGVAPEQPDHHDGEQRQHHRLDRHDAVSTSTVDAIHPGAHRHPASCVHVNWSTAAEQLQFRQSIRHGMMHVTSRHMIGVDVRDLRVALAVAETDAARLEVLQSSLPQWQPPGHVRARVRGCSRGSSGCSWCRTGPRRRSCTATSRRRTCSSGHPKLSPPGSVQQNAV